MTTDITNINSSLPDTDYEYRKGDHYRVISPDGVWGGITPSGMVEMVVYTDHRSPPPDDQLVDVTRELETCIMLRPDIAVAVRDWLDRYITEQQTS